MPQSVVPMAVLFSGNLPVLGGGVEVEVAQLAGLPRSVVHRAREILEDLEGDSRTAKPLSKKRRLSAAQQLSFLEQKSPLLEELEKLDLDAMTPLEALNRLYELKKRAEEG